MLDVLISSGQVTIVTKLSSNSTIHGVLTSPQAEYVVTENIPTTCPGRSGSRAIHGLRSGGVTQSRFGIDVVGVWMKTQFFFCETTTQFPQVRVCAFLKAFSEFLPSERCTVFLFCFRPDSADSVGQSGNMTQHIDM